jgi:hypothetical protein
MPVRVMDEMVRDDDPLVGSHDFSFREEASTWLNESKLTSR